MGSLSRAMESSAIILNVSFTFLQKLSLIEICYNIHLCDLFLLIGNATFKLIISSFQTEIFLIKHCSDIYHQHDFYGKAEESLRKQ